MAAVFRLFIFPGIFHGITEKFNQQISFFGNYIPFIFFRNKSAFLSNIFKKIKPGFFAEIIKIPA